MSGLLRLYRGTCTCEYSSMNVDATKFLDTVKPVLRDHCKETPVLSWRTRYSWQKFLHFNIHVNEPVTKDHLTWRTTIVCPNETSFKIGSTVYKLVKKIPGKKKNTKVGLHALSHRGHGFSMGLPDYMYSGPSLCNHLLIKTTSEYTDHFLQYQNHISNVASA